MMLVIRSIHFVSVQFDAWTLSTEVTSAMEATLKIAMIVDDYCNSTYYLFSDWQKAQSEISKSAPETSSSCRLCQVKVTGNHVMYDRGARFSKGNHVKFARFVLVAISEEAKK